MTLYEFATWFEGFSDAVAGDPSREQWEVVRAKFAQVHGLEQFQRSGFIERMVIGRHICQPHNECLEVN